MDAFSKRIEVKRETLTRCPVCGSGLLVEELRTHEVLDHYGISRCQTCELCFTNPKPIDADIPKLYDDRAAGMDLGTDSRISFGMKSLKIGSYVRRLLSLTKLDGNFSVLDAGCGDGMIAYKFAEMPRCSEAMGIDFHPTAPPLFTNPKMEYRSYTDLPFNRKFDIIVLRHVIEHVSDTNKFLESLVPLLSERGYVFIEVPDYRSHWRKLFGVYYNQLVIPFHIYHFTPASISRAITCLSIEKVEGANIPVIGPSLGRALGIRVSQIGLVAAAFYPFQIAIDALLNNHAAMLVVARHKSA